MTRPIPTASLLALAVLAVFTLTLRGQETLVSDPASVSTEVAPYDELLQKARACASEQSWALASQTFSEAGNAAPDEAARRWCKVCYSDRPDLDGRKRRYWIEVGRNGR